MPADYQDDEEGIPRPICVLFGAGVGWTPADELNGRRGRPLYYKGHCPKCCTSIRCGIHGHHGPAGGSRVYCARCGRTGFESRLFANYQSELLGERANRRRAREQARRRSRQQEQQQKSQNGTHQPSRNGHGKGPPPGGHRRQA